MDNRLLEIIACPICHGKLIYDKNRAELICKADRLGYPVHEGIPVLIDVKARDISTFDEK